ncbi:coiled-coil domain-containing protein [endosymbiont GvMRE of Glomus versiforme]|uniref:coiled-coil domain-containing protein n=1 Tax=endosymbiont GvMRE of Glomus versiforme TaxID=2039283 RepID=UPI000EE7748B|nr:hypothetical protein [endosymbiont GvMRE of Glomus versiforme]RHZ35348.1 hypothetical protein GvMRE_IIg86 [endosymbiont GvMRE of Glomus versiforme]
MKNNDKTKKNVKIINPISDKNNREDNGKNKQKKLFSQIPGPGIFFKNNAIRIGMSMAIMSSAINGTDAFIFNSHTFKVAAATTGIVGSGAFCLLNSWLEYPFEETNNFKETNFFVLNDEISIEDNNNNKEDDNKQLTLAPIASKKDDKVFLGTIQKILEEPLKHELELTKKEFIELLLRNSEYLKYFFKDWETKYYSKEKAEKIISWGLNSFNCYQIVKFIYNFFNKKKNSKNNAQKTERNLIIMPNEETNETIKENSELVRIKYEAEKKENKQIRKSLKTAEKTIEILESQYYEYYNKIKELQKDKGKLQDEVVDTKSLQIRSEEEIEKIQEDANARITKAGKKYMSEREKTRTLAEEIKELQKRLDNEAKHTQVLDFINRECKLRIPKRRLNVLEIVNYVKNSPGKVKDKKLLERLMKVEEQKSQLESEIIIQQKSFRIQLSEIKKEKALDTIWSKETIGILATFMFVILASILSKKKMKNIKEIKRNITL